VHQAHNASAIPSGTDVMSSHVRTHMIGPTAPTTVSAANH
jgi:hypothetical protein